MVSPPPAAGGKSSFRGRTDECALLDGLVAAVRRGESRSLVLLGEAGIGKTALLEYLVESASDMTVIRAAGVESDMELAYASLHHLCLPLLDRLERIPAPQRDTLGVVFGLSAGSAPDRFLVALAVLSLLSEAAEQRSVLMVVDDAQWLDKASALTLAFVTRRLLAEPVGVVFAAREPGEELQHVSALDVRGVRDDDARALLDSAVPFKLDERVRDRIIAEARGNPLALLELPRGLTATQLAGGFGLLEAQALTGRIEDSYTRRLQSLPESARLLLLLAAAEPIGDPLLLWRAAERLGIGRMDADRAEAHGLLAVGERVRFRHPLVRSAIYRSATAQERRPVHMALAQATDHEADPDRRAWHLAAAAAEPDEAVASELERSAVRAQARGGLAAAAAFLQRSLALTQESARRGDRALAAAQASLQAGDFDTALGLLATAETGALDEFQRAQVELVRAQLSFAVNRGSDAPPLLLKAARQFASLDPRLARDTYLEALFAALFAGRLGRGGGVVEAAEAARAAPAPPHHPRAADLLLDGYAMTITEGYAVGAPILQRAVKAFQSQDIGADEVLRWAFLATYAAQALWDEESYRALPTRQIQLARDAGALSVLPMSLTFRMGAYLHAGELAAAESMLQDLDVVTEATGTQLPPYAAVALACWRGREAEARELMKVSMNAVAARGEGIGVTFIEWTSTVLYNGLGRYEDALVAARTASEHREELQSPLWLHELVEAAARSGKPDLAADALEELADMTRIVGTAWALGIEARSRALLSENAAAERLYREAIDHLARTEARVELARAHLLYGEWLRREGRRVDARAQLRTAHDQLASIGAEAFAERARQELLATGETVRKRTVVTRDDLTPQERQIAHLARDGLSNPEIGARLFLSPRTVEWHLRNVFSKVGIHSRRELAEALPRSESKRIPA
jgi:DNA-binding CsgD family transcriptional regulator